jgi:DNA-directed RNA polymerase subunit RPC12/RpoP
MIHVRCAHCGRAWDVGDHLAGLTIICKNCSERISVAPTSTERPTTITLAATSAPPTLSFKSPQSSPPPLHKFPESEPSTWAEDYVEASHKVGLTVTQIEEHLVKRGLDRAAALTLIEMVLGKKVRARTQPLEAEDRHKFWHRLLALIVMAVYVFWGGAFMSIPMLMVMALVLTSICFPGYLSARAGIAHPWILRWLAWLVLLIIVGRRFVYLFA